MPIVRLVRSPLNVPLTAVELTEFIVTLTGFVILLSSLRKELSPASIAISGITSELPDVSKVFPTVKAPFKVIDMLVPSAALPVIVVNVTPSRVPVAAMA